MKKYNIVSGCNYSLGGNYKSNPCILEHEAWVFFDFLCKLFFID